MPGKVTPTPGDEGLSRGAETVAAFRVTVDDRVEVQELVVRESPLTIYLNGEEVVTLLCTPVDLSYLAVGFLESEGLISRAGAIPKVVVDEMKGIAWVESPAARPIARDLLYRRLLPSGCGRGAMFYQPVDSASREKVSSPIKVTPQQILDLAIAFQRRSLLFRATGGVHSAALCDLEKIVIFSEDIARHNAVDRVFGQCLMEGIPADGRVLLTSGRISSEVLLKAAKRQVPLLVSKSAPTTLALRLAEELGVTVVGYARGKRMNVYTHPGRVIG